MFIPKAVLFDLDGVLLDTEPINQIIWEKTINEIGIKSKKLSVKGFEGKTRKDCAKIISNFLKNKLSINKVLEIHKKFFNQNMVNIKPILFAEELIDLCFYLNLDIALVSSSSLESFSKKIVEHPWLCKINIKILGDNKNLKNRKPFPDPYLLAASMLKIDISDCCAVEDSLAGVYSAFNAGCYVFCLDKYENELKKNLLLNNFDINHPRLKFVNNLREIIYLFGKIFN